MTRVHLLPAHQVFNIFSNLLMQKKLLSVMRNKMIGFTTPHIYTYYIMHIFIVRNTSVQLSISSKFGGREKKGEKLRKKKRSREKEGES